MSAPDCCSNDIIDTPSPGQRILERIRMFAQKVAEARRHRRTREVIRALDDKQLTDIGVARADVDPGFQSDFTRDLGHSYSRQTMFQPR